MEEEQACKTYAGDGMKNDTKPVWLSPGQMMVPANLNKSEIGRIVEYFGKYPPQYMYTFDWWEHPEYEELRKSKLFTLVVT
jgi:hypothetical protein